MIVSSSLEVYTLCFFVIGFGALVMPLLPKGNNTARTFLSILLLGFAVFYFKWRLFETVLPAHFFSKKGFWIYLCFFVEVLGWLEGAIFYTMLSKTRDNKKAALLYELALRQLPNESLPTVDVFIPTYNEPADILEKTIVGAIHLDWPKEKLKVYVLDDGSREEIKTLCHELGAIHITREVHDHAKAGNINHAFLKTTGKYVAIFDADFVAHKNFLLKTIGFFQDPAVAIVQSPQVFYNEDFVQSNLGLHHTLPDDQRLFFEVILPARDAWDCAFFCGSCGVLDRQKITSSGGLSYESITEDILLSLRLLKHGYVTRYLNENLSQGLAPESIESFTIQRKRWCQGNIQLLFIPNGLFSKGVSFIQRLFFLPVYWIVSPFIQVFMLCVPIVYFLTDAIPMYVESTEDVFTYQIPFFLLAYFIMIWHASWRWVPLITSAYANLTAFSLVTTVFKSLNNPFGEKFKVTPKGSLNKKKTYHPLSLWCSVSFFTVTFMSIVINLFPSYRIVSAESLIPIAVGWCLINMLTLFFMIILSFEHPRNRQEERFDVNQEAKALLNGQKHLVYIKDASLGGAQFQALHLPDVTNGVLSIPTVGDIPFERVYHTQNLYRIKFLHADAKTKRHLIAWLYTGNFFNVHKPMSLLSFIGFVLRRLISSDVKK